MRIAISFSVLFFLQCSIAGAAFTDFSDYPQSVEFESNELFQSKGLQFKANYLFPFANQKAFVYVNTNSISEPYHQLHPGSGVEFLLPAGTREVSLAYSDGAGANIVVNGLQPIFPLGVARLFSLVDGTTLAGVSIETDSSTLSSSFEEGLLTLRGPISSLVIAGVELSIDDVSVIVPEPTTAALLLAACVSLLIGRKRGKVQLIGFSHAIQ